MALSPKEINKVVQLLGYGGKMVQAGSVIYNKILNDRLHTLPLDTEELIREYLQQVYAIETQLFQAPARLAAKVIGDITTNLEEMQMLRAERRKIGREIAVHLDIPYSSVGGANMSVSN
jgi:hypothetical protein